MNAARGAEGLHALRRVHRVTPDVVDEFVGADHARKQFPAVQADAQLHGLVELDSHPRAQLAHFECHFGHRGGVVGPRLRQPASDHVAVADRLDLFQPEPRRQRIEFGEESAQ